MAVASVFVTNLPRLVIPANAGIHLDLRFAAESNIKLDPSVRWDDGTKALG
jgi:hypothetical protein